jgi:hypothetical protein
MNVMQNLLQQSTVRQSQISPEIHEALRTIRAAEHRLERETFIFDIEARLEMAAELADTLAELPDELADATGRVILALDDETETFEDWGTRCDAAARLRGVVRGLESEVRA